MGLVGCLRAMPMTYKCHHRGRPTGHYLMVNSSLDMTARHCLRNAYGVALSGSCCCLTGRSACVGEDLFLMWVWVLAVRVAMVAACFDMRELMSRECTNTYTVHVHSNETGLRALAQLV